ncbi:hypothetical protein [Lentiprolixibacter aurantiacus]|uniref:Secreted protein n=1 Tax=Lentiprolixibacter aurantiacus TaxID=2993939 RepID=A0AAE3MIH7_9FLAO|nr:hypothetical protein [Lentiprolixibacter aurantiacus]MCX2718203.1 hypothetical protein [Lentiprolixibacter aurantiacus]
MKSAFLLISALIFTCTGWGQTDIPKRQPLKISAEKKLEVKSIPNKGTALNMPSILDKNPDAKFKDPLKERNVKMLPEKQLKQAGFDMKIDPKVGEGERNSSGKFFGDMYLGDVKTSSKFIGVVCRDHEFVDGDRVKVYVNDIVVEPNILLTGNFKGVNIDLDKGFNRLDFEALNQGTSGPNTAQVDVFDENGKLLYSNKWLLSTGSKASLIVVQE